MNWVVKTLTSTLGRKLIMALTGAFLSLFLVVHLIGNLQLLKDDGGMAFNIYADFMGHNPLIQTVSILNFTFIILHIITSVILTRLNNKARPVSYAYDGKSSAWSSRNMGILGTVILIFLVVHLSNFWGKSKLTTFEAGSYVPYVTYGEATMQNLYDVVAISFQEWWLVALYVVSMIGLAFHLSHGFISMFQTLGLNHSKYNFVIKIVGYEFAILVPAMFAAIPVFMFLNLQGGLLYLFAGIGVLALVVGAMVSNGHKQQLAV
ncbi:MAG: succinate dehydrogenase cytochrome b subunit [Thermonemataceae bacterium]